ncbi:C2H2-type zinc finger-containing protein [Cavenderia fasciculata]|uniref:C2H2-type zinc finger-containing protein n=1 Tax=Cavenderia fasciculata TaxID=261658 RepID=F4Q016_CACFS|nr:C2H2-type zinc finger-containing protein [Cavenderia fasciculata]EGG18930.1 C2H2-type zinc finger-containing protein [Cavenderia fasciculata]|eukprot:XP_004357392.1 C2H2-type zinc finger-containing protein [Cavenderia fasciculata]
MSSSLIERTRNLHESIERYELLIVGEQANEPKTVKESIIQSHRVNHYLESSIECAKELGKIYKDEDQTRKNEISGITGTGNTVYSNFYENLREIKEYHRKYPNLPVENLNTTLYYTPQISFTGNESYGRFLDLNEIYNQYVNVPKVNRIDYVKYLTTFTSFSYDDINRLGIQKYKLYIESLYEYLISFLKKTQPLFDLQKTLSDMDKEFEEKWSNQEFTSKNDGVVVAVENNSENNNNGNGIGGDDDDSNGKEPKDNDKNGEEETTKEEEKKKNDTKTTTIVSLDCKACKKSFTSQGVFNSHLKGKRHIMLQEILDKNSETSKSSSGMLPFKPIVQKEFYISKFGDMLSDQIEDSKENTLKKQSRTLKEIEEDLYADETVLDDDEMDEEPLKLRIANYPVDWSGKPIPYWVYKLNELGIEYKCEICGNQSYWGRKAYEKHFTESRHAYGMSCIGVPNTVHFNHITKIKDAIELYKKIKDQNATAAFNADREEEYEDENGDVMNKKTYEMMVKQEKMSTEVAADWRTTITTGERQNMTYRVYVTCQKRYPSKSADECKVTAGDLENGVYKDPKVDTKRLYVEGIQAIVKELQQGTA